MEQLKYEDKDLEVDLVYVIEHFSTPQLDKIFFANTNEATIYVTQELKAHYYDNTEDGKLFVKHGGFAYIVKKPISVISTEKK